MSEPEEPEPVTIEFTVDTGRFTAAAQGAQSSLMFASHPDLRGEADQLARPSREGYPDNAAYELAWHTWRAIQRDGRLNAEELDAQFAVNEAHVRRLFE
ncbi:hypothetical protein [Streptomyces sp. NPDC005302]|uniref:hypothetical protein n=1 Tax=Streptomyces sp. NPDC005302 TaxID=3154675 RepID=UPI0033B3850A